MLALFFVLAQLFGYPSVPLAPIPVPTGVYIGGFANTQGKSATASQKEGDVEAIETTIGRRYAIQLHYYTFSTLTQSALLTDQTIRGDLSKRRIPLLSWTCGTPLTNYSSGANDATIDAAAFALKNLGIPVGLRFFHEFNLCLTAASCANGDNPNCFTAGYTDAQKGAQFVAAWEHIWTRFKADGATNVSFIWCPGGNAANVSAHNLALWLPPSPYVDWIGWDVYDKGNVGLVSTIQPFYNAFSSYGLPMVLDETGEVNGNSGTYTQAQYLSDLSTNAASTFPLMHAFLWFSSYPSSFDWIYDSGGLSELTTVSNQTYFDVFGY